MLPKAAGAQDTRTSFEPWIAAFQTRAVAEAIMEETDTLVTRGVHPDTTGLEATRNQPDLRLQL